MTIRHIRTSQASAALDTSLRICMQCSPHSLLHTRSPSYALADWTSTLSQSPESGYNRVLYFSQTPWRCNVGGHHRCSPKRSTIGTEYRDLEDDDGYDQDLEDDCVIRTLKTTARVVLSEIFFMAEISYTLSWTWNLWTS